MPDLLAEPQEIPTLDESLFNSQPMDIDFGPKDNDPLNWTSQVFSDPVSSIEQGRKAPEELPTLYDDDLEIEIDMDDGPSIELGRDAPPPRPAGEDLMVDEPSKLHADDLDLNFDDDESVHANELPEPLPLDDGIMDLDEQDTFNLNTTPGPEVPAGDQPQPPRDSQSPLSSARSSEIREFDESTVLDEPVKQAKQPAAKRRKLLPMDAETMLHSSHIKELQKDRSSILKPVSFLPKDPLLLTLMNMQQTGGFVSGIMGDGRAKGWAPELRGILSIEVIRKSSNLKRKREVGATDEDGAMPQIEIPEDDDQIQIDGPGEIGHADKSTMLDIPADDGMPPPPIDDDEDNFQAGGFNDDGNLSPPHMNDAFDETTAPLLLPHEQGPVSVGTKHAVYMYRDYFGGSAAASSQRKHALFQDLIPTASKTKIEATRMFFETLVLATKDAVKIEQVGGDLGAPIRIRPKRALWGDWAEKEAGGEIEKEEQEEQAAAIEAAA